MTTPTVYTVLTEFKFEVGSALVNSEKVQNAVDGISASADNALQSLKGLGLGFVTNFGLGATSVIGVLTQALKTSDSFTKNQLAFSNIISSNMKNMTGDVETFNDRMMLSGRILRDIARDAQKFGLPEQELAGMTKLLAATLAPKGMAGPNFSEARNMGRNLLKSAPVLGVEPIDVQGQLLRAIQGGAHMGDPLFRSLANETAAFKEKFKGAVDVAKRFNALPIKERFQVLRDGLGQFAKDTDVLAGNAQTAGAMMRRISDLFTGFNGILKPLGDVIRAPLVNGFEDLFKLLNEDGRRVVSEFASTVGLFVKDIRSSTVGLLQGRELGRDFKAAGTALGIGVLVHWLIQIGVLKALISLTVKPFALLVSNVGLLFGALKYVWPILAFVAGAVIKFSVALLPLLALFQLLSRAQAIGKITDLSKLPGVMAGLSEQFRRFTELLTLVFGPALQLFDTIAGSMAWLFEFSFWLEGVVTLFKFLNDVFVTVFGVVRGFIFSIGQLVQNLAQGKLLGAFSGISDQFRIGTDDFFDQYLQRTLKPDGTTAVANNVTNIGKVEISNQFKEQMEPDRIAFALVDQLRRVAENPQGAFGRSRAKPLMGR